MTENSRRNLLKAIAAGSCTLIAGKSLPEKWARPVVDSVTLPAHAQTSAPACPGPYTAEYPNAFFLAVDTTTGTYTTLVVTPPPPPGFNVGFIYLNDGNFLFNIDNAAWISGTNLGANLYGVFTSTLVSNSGSFTLNATVELCGPQTINISGLTITPV